MTHTTYNHIPIVGNRLYRKSVNDYRYYICHIPKVGNSIYRTSIYDRIPKVDNIETFGSFPRKEQEKERDKKETTRIRVYTRDDEETHLLFKLEGFSL